MRVFNSLNINVTAQELPQTTADQQDHDPKNLAPQGSSAEVDGALVRGAHVLDIDKRVLSTPLLEQGERVADKLAQAVILLLAVVDAVAQVLVPAGRQEQREDVEPFMLPFLSHLHAYTAAAAPLTQTAHRVMYRLKMGRICL